MNMYLHVGVCDFAPIIYLFSLFTVYVCTDY